MIEFWVPCTFVISHDASYQSTGFSEAVTLAVLCRRHAADQPGIHIVLTCTVEKYDGGYR